MVLAAGSAPGDGRVRATRRFDEWREAIRHDFVALDMAPDRRFGEFTGEVHSATVGHLQVSRVRSVPQVCRRTPGLAGADSREFLQVGMVTRGIGVLTQDGRRTVLATGDFAVYETGRPFSWNLSHRWELDVFTWPRAAIGLTAAESAGATAIRLPGGHGLSGIVGGVLRGLLTAPQLSPAGAVRVADEVGELVATLAIEHAEPSAPPDAPQRALLREVCAHIDAHLADPDLGPDTIARAHFVSTRQLHRLFAATGETVARRIRRLRLERCRRELTDRRRAGDSVTDIARRWAFADLAAFSRAFRTTYGCSPSDYRARLAPAG
ncbi:helix-turn-helix domain-containing protein [Pseudonocardia humida]|uniref:Helix-turn-helix domain-containing protein n=1 Tax=Pseudonocardia humida TaxID=2800819 RepID=A0ABT1A6M7_9PSEU|nr:helix-turn-helix domain-containing protein [Pseudonocardia humida]MCO1658658.1 helix-turn-helix domain-containing protein [Pseudonocardia humida]